MNNNGGVGGVSRRVGPWGLCSRNEFRHSDGCVCVFLSGLFLSFLFSVFFSLPLFFFISIHFASSTIAITIDFSKYCLLSWIILSLVIAFTIIKKEQKNQSTVIPIYELQYWEWLLYNLGPINRGGASFLFHRGAETFLSLFPFLLFLFPIKEDSRILWGICPYASSAFANH